MLHNVKTMQISDEDDKHCIKNVSPEIPCDLLIFPYSFKKTITNCYRIQLKKYTFNPTFHSLTHTSTKYVQCLT
jgi:hypothetical protein